MTSNTHDSWTSNARVPFTCCKTFPTQPNLQPATAVAACAALSLGTCTVTSNMACTGSMKQATHAPPRCLNTTDAATCQFTAIKHASHAPGIFQHPSSNRAHRRMLCHFRTTSVPVLLRTEYPSRNSRASPKPHAHSNIHHQQHHAAAARFPFHRHCARAELYAHV